MANIDEFFETFFAVLPGEFKVDGVNGETIKFDANDETLDLDWSSSNFDSQVCHPSQECPANVLV